MSCRQFKVVNANKYVVLAAHDPTGRLHRKELTIAAHGGICANPLCKKRYDPKKRNAEEWHHAHLVPISEAEKSTSHGDWWGHWWKDQPPFTDEWWAYVWRIRPTCCLTCNYAVEGGIRPVVELPDIKMDDFPTYLMKDRDLFE